MSMLEMTKLAVVALIRKKFVHGWFGDVSQHFIIQQQHAAVANMKKFWMIHHRNLQAYCNYDVATMSRVAMALGLSVHQGNTKIPCILVDEAKGCNHRFCRTCGWTPRTEATRTEGLTKANV